MLLTSYFKYYITCSASFHITYRRTLMSEQILSISEAQKELTRLPEQFEKGPEAVTVTRYGKPVMAILPYNTYKSLLEAIEALQETLEILQDKDLMSVFHESVEALQKGELVDWEEAKRELGLA